LITSKKRVRPATISRSTHRTADMAHITLATQSVPAGRSAVPTAFLTQFSGHHQSQYVRFLPGRNVYQTDSAVLQHYGTHGITMSQEIAGTGIPGQTAGAPLNTLPSIPGWGLVCSNTNHKYRKQARQHWQHHNGGTSTLHRRLIVSPKCIKVTPCPGCTTTMQLPHD
jgi:hypothetical protein